MTPFTFQTAITNIFKEEFTDTLKIQDEPSNTLLKSEQRENIEAIYFAVTQIFDKTITDLKEDTILLLDLIRSRRTIYQLAKKIDDLEIKEKQDVIDMEERTKWHERNQLIRLFVSSDKGDQLDQEREEAKMAKSITEQLADKLTNFERFLDKYIVETGAASNHHFLLLVEEWKLLGELKESLMMAKQNIELGQSKLKTRVSCSKGGSSRVNNTRSRKHFSLAINHLESQINIYKPTYEEINKKVESKILQVRNQLLIE